MRFLMRADDVNRYAYDDYPHKTPSGVADFRRGEVKVGATAKLATTDPGEDAPQGKLRLTDLPPDLAAFFEPGAEYVVTIEKAGAGKVT